MPMSHRDRFRLKSQLVNALGTPDWPHSKINLLLSEFGLDQLDDDWNGPGVSEHLSSVDDTTLVELYGLVFDIDEREVEDSLESTVDDNWKQGYARVFLSHSAHHKAFVGEIANELAVVGIHGFVAHDAMAYSKPWQQQIEQGLRSMQAFVAVVHPEFNSSAWCHEEVGWALGRRVPRYAVRVGSDPEGFLGREQWPSGHGLSPKQVAHVIYKWIAEIPELGTPIVDGLFSALAAAGNYYDAEAAAQRIVALGSLPERDWDRLDVAYWSNDQVRGGVLPTRQLKPFYLSNGRSWPPVEPKAEVPTNADDPWG